MDKAYSAISRAHLRVAELLLDERDPAVLQVCAENLQIALRAALHCSYEAAGIPYRVDWGVDELVAHVRPRQICLEPEVLEDAANCNHLLRNIRKDLETSEQTKAETAQLAGLVQQIEPLLRKFRRGAEVFYAMLGTGTSEGIKPLNLQ